MEKYKNYLKLFFRPASLALLVLITGLLLGKWWWQIGALVIVILLFEAYVRYRSMD